MLAKSGAAALGTGTRHISVASATNALHAARFAAETGRAFTLRVTINWDRLGIDDDGALNIWRAFRERVVRSWRYLREKHGVDVGRLPGIAAHENPAGRRNTHWMVAVPSQWEGEFRRVVAKFLAKVAGVAELGAALLIEPLYAVGGAMKYALKGIAPAYQDYFHIEAEDQGFVAGRGRTFVSREISQAERKRQGWMRTRRPRAPRAPARRPPDQHLGIVPSK